MTTLIRAVTMTGALLLSAFVLSAGNALAMPLLDPEIATDADITAKNIDGIRWVCGPYRCWWRPNYYYRPYGWYRPYGRPYGWRHPYGW